MPQALDSLNRVTAIVVTYNSRHCLEALAQGLAALPHVVIVDNASADGTLDEARRVLPHARLVALDANLGFGAANNRGVAQAQTEFVLLINPDCTFEPAAIAGLVETADRFPDASVIGPQLVDAQGRPEATYRWMTPAWRSRGPGADAPACVGFLSGACLLVRSAAMRAVGGFDEGFFLYYEDDDLCLRLQAQCGALIVDPEHRVCHRSRGSVAGPKRAQAEFLRGFHHIQSKFRFAEKHLRSAVPVPRRLLYLVGALAEALVRLLLLDTRRAARVWGRAVGILRYRAD